MKNAIKEAQQRCFDAMVRGDLAAQVREYERLETLERVARARRETKHALKAVAS